MLGLGPVSGMPVAGYNDLQVIVHFSAHPIKVVGYIIKTIELSGEEE